MPETRPETAETVKSSTQTAASDDQQKYEEMVDLYNQVEDYFLHRYMKLSHKNMDMKIRVLKERLAGKTPPEIGPDWDTVQEED